MAIFPHSGIETDIPSTCTRFKFITYDPIVIVQTITKNVTFRAKQYTAAMAKLNETD